jgi:hypothetical protein
VGAVVLRIILYLSCVVFFQISSGAIADTLDPYFQSDLQKANADPRYSHLVRSSEKVRVYRLHNYVPGNWDTLDPTFDGIISSEAAAKIRASSGSNQQRTTSKRKTAPVAAKPTEEAALTSDIAAAPKPSQAAPAMKVTAAATGSESGQWVAYVRKDFTDIYSLIAPNSAPASTGATFSYASDQIAKNTTVSGQGAIFAGYTYLAPQFNLHSQPYLLGVAAGPYYTFNEARNTNSADFSKNTDSQTYGGTAEIATGNVLGIDTLTEYTRVSLGNTEDYIKRTSALSGTLNIIPVYAPLWVHWPHGFPTSETSNFLFRIDPSFVVQYDSVEGKKQILLFSNQTKSLRIGPQIGFWSVPFDGVTYFENFVANVTYHWATEAYSNQDFHWFEADLTYKLSPAFGITASYQNGKTETTGTKTNQYTISLSSALDYCVPACADASASSSSSQ